MTIGDSIRLSVLLALCTTTSFGAAVLPGFDAFADGRNDDGTYTAGGCTNNTPGGTCSGTLVPIGFDIQFYSNIYDSIYVNTNGNVTFDGPLATFDPFGLEFAFQPIVAPYFSDIDTRNPASGVVTFGSGFFDGRNAFGVNWIDVGYFDMHVDSTNSFQLLFVDRSDTGAGNFDIIFNYDRVLFEASDASFGVGGLGGFSAHVGFSSGTGLPDSFVSLPGSGIPGSFVDGGTLALVDNRLNSDVDGRYIFNVRETAPIPEPGTLILSLGGLAVLWIRQRRIHRK